MLLFPFFKKQNRNGWDNSKKCRDVQCNVTRVIWRQGKVTTYHVTPWPQIFVLFIQCTGTELITHEVWSIGKENLFYGLKCLFYHIFETLSNKTMKTSTSVCASQCRIETNVADWPCRILWLFDARCGTGYILRRNSKGHWKVKIITIAAEASRLRRVVLSCFKPLTSKELNLWFA